MDAGVDPFRIKPQCLTADELENRLHVNRKLIKVAIPFMQKLYQIVQGSSFVVALLDVDGYILHVIGDPDIFGRFPLLKVGENWSEDAKGTNAMGTVLVERRDLQVFATEHYCQPNQGLTCSAAPIYGCNDQIIGMLDMSGDYRQAHAHTLGMVMAAVQAISNQMQLEKASAQILRSYKQITAITESVSEGIIAFDREGIVTAINSKAAGIIGESRDKLVNQPSLARFFSDAEAARLLEMSMNDKARHEREMVINSKRSQLRFMVSGVPIRDDDEAVCGGVITLREVRAVQDLVTDLVGAHAYYTFDDIIGESAVMQEVVKTAKMVSNGHSSVLLSGESGTGKEVFAQAIHNGSSRAHRPFVAVNCGAIPRELVESELFGYEEGAFTGAKRGGKPGKFELASGGTIFLDEIGEMPTEIQVVLLRVLQERQIVRIGGVKPIPIDVRVIAATSKNLAREVEEGRFRRDLFYRLNVIPISIPSLKERGDDIITLAEHFLGNFSQKMFQEPLALSAEAAACLKAYPWPGNVRELANVMERTVSLADADETKEIKIVHLSEMIVRNGIKKTVSSLIRHTSRRSIEDNQRQLIMDTLRECQGNMSTAASVLGVGRTTLYRKLRRYNISLDELRL